MSIVITINIRNRLNPILSNLCATQITCNKTGAIISTKAQKQKVVQNKKEFNFIISITIYAKL